MGLLDLVEQNDAVRAPAHRLGQAPALAIADIAGRRALERRDRVRLLELGHVDRDDVLLAAVERLGERERRLGLADAGRAAQHEDADRLHGIVEPRAIGLDALGDHLEAVALSDDAPVENVGEVEHGLDLVGDHLADRNARPVGHDGGDRLLVDMRVDHPLFRIDLAEFADLGAQGLAVGRGLLRLCAASARAAARRRAAAALPRARMARPAAAAAARGPFAISSRSASDFLDQRALLGPVGFQRGESLARARELRVDLGDALLFGGAEVALARERLPSRFRARRSRLPRPRPPRAWRSG